MHPTTPVRLARRALLAVAAVAVVVASGTPTRVIDWVAAHDGIDVPYVRDCKGILRHPEECPAPPGQVGREARDGSVVVASPAKA